MLLCVETETMALLAMELELVENFLSIKILLQPLTPTMRFLALLIL